MTRVDLFLSVAGSIGTPFYREFPPADDLRAFVACTWVRLVRRSGSKAMIRSSRMAASTSWHTTTSHRALPVLTLSRAG